MVARVDSPAHGCHIEQHENHDRGENQNHTEIHFCIVLPDPAGSVHNPLHIVPGSCSRVDTQPIEPLQLAIGGRVGHRVPVERAVAPVRNKRDNKSLSSKYERH